MRPIELKAVLALGSFLGPLRRTLASLRSSSSLDDQESMIVRTVASNECGFWSLKTYGVEKRNICLMRVVLV